MVVFCFNRYVLKAIVSVGNYFQAKYVLPVVAKRERRIEILARNDNVT